MRNALLLTPFLFLAACGDGKKEAAEQLAAMDSLAAATKAGTVVDLSKFDTPLTVDLGDLATLRVDTPTVKWNEEFGRLEVGAGEHFGITITEEPADIARLKADLERDMLQKHTVIEEGADNLVYRSQFPDDAAVFIHFQRVVQVGDRTFVVRDADQGRFNEADVARMVGSVKPKVAA